MKKSLWLLVGILILLLTVDASAATLKLPESLTTIEEEAFAENAALDQVVLGNKTQVIDGRAFADSGVKLVTIPASVRYIADNAFEGVEELEIDAAEGTYAYAWGVKHGYIKLDEIPDDAETKVVMPEELQAGMDLEIQVFGAVNSVRHTVFLVNNATKKSKVLWIGEQNGTAVWNGYELESGTYTVKVYTVTDNYSTSTPVTKDLVISGTRPAAPEIVELPEKISRYNSYPLEFKTADRIMIRYDNYNADGERINGFEEEPIEKEYWLWCDENAETVEVSYCVYINRLWSAWSDKKTIQVSGEIVNPMEYPQIISFSMPDTIVEGEDIEISFELDKEVNFYNAALNDANGQEIQYYSGSNLSAATLIIPGYKMDAGSYRLYIEVEAEIEGETAYYTVLEREITVTEGRKSANITLTVSKVSVYTNEAVELSISSNGTEGAYIRITGDRTNYKGCNLQNDGSGTCNTTLDVLNSASRSREVTLSACVYMGDSWSAWSDPITITVSRPEPLPVPVIGAKDTYETGEDIVVTLDGVEEADWYSVELIEYFSRENVIYKSYSKGNMWIGFGEDVVFSGSQFGSGTYQIRVSSYSSVRQSSTGTKTIKVSGTRSAAPTVTYDPDEFRINRTTTFTIDTTDYDEVLVQYDGYDKGNYYGWGNSETIEPTGNTTTWTYRFENDAEGAKFIFRFTGKKDGKWTYTREIQGTVLGLPPLEPAVIHSNDSYEAGKDFSIVIDPVENATYYTYIFTSPDGRSTYYSNIGEHTYGGYELDPGEYIVKVQAHSEDYADSWSEKHFTITGTKPPAPTVSADKTEFYSNETRPIITVTAKGAEAVRCSDGSVSAVPENGRATFTPYMYLYEGNENTYQFRFCAVVHDVWTAWSEPVSITIKKAETPELLPLEEAAIHLPDSIKAGQDFAFSFDAVSDAASYSAYISRYYVSSNIYSNYNATPDTEMTVSGRTLTPGTYVAKVYAEADGRERSCSSVKFTVTGERGPAPEVTSDKTECAGGETIVFNIDTAGCDEAYVSYDSYGKYSTSGQRELSPQTETTEWTYTVPGNYNNTVYTFSFYVKRDGIWSQPGEIRITIP